MFYERFIHLCENSDEKPTVVLKEIGISPSNMQKWKNGATVNSNILVKLSNHFGVTTDYLLGREEKNTTNINTANNSQIDNSTVIGVSNGKQYDETTNQVAEEFSRLSFLDKIKVMSLIAELNGNK